MAERTQLQYTPIQGPVWSEPVAERLAWLPRVQQPGRGLPPNRLGDFVQPAFDALYKPEGLQWSPSDRYAGQALPFALARSGVIDPIPPENPRLLDWQAQDRYYGRALPRAFADYSAYPYPQAAAPVYDPSTMEWSPRGSYPQIALEYRKLGDFESPPFAALFRPEGLQWLPCDRYAGRPLAAGRLDWTVFQQPVAAFDPVNLEWLPMGTAPQIPLELRRIGDSWYSLDESTFAPVPDVHQPGMLLREAPRRIFSFRKDSLAHFYDDFSEPEFLKSVEETLKESQKPGKAKLAREIGALSALNTLASAYGAHFDSVKAARAAIAQIRKELGEAELTDEEMFMLMMMIAIADEP